MLFVSVVRALLPAGPGSMSLEEGRDGRDNSAASYAPTQGEPERLGGLEIDDQL